MTKKGSGQMSGQMRQIVYKVSILEEKNREYYINGEKLQSSKLVYDSEGANIQGQQVVRKTN